MDTDDYFWESTNPPYTTKRNVSDRIILMRKNIAKYNKVVISGSLVDWSDELISFFTLAIRVETDTAIRIDRLKRRERVNGKNYCSVIKFYWTEVYLWRRTLKLYSRVYKFQFVELIALQKTKYPPNTSGISKQEI